MINSEKALKLLSTRECMVKLSIALGEYRTEPIVNNNKVYIPILGDTHIHNIQSIKIDNKWQKINWNK